MGDMDLMDMWGQMGWVAKARGLHPGVHVDVVVRRGD